MSTHKLFAVTFAIVLGLVAFVPLSRADEWNQMTRMTFTQPVEVPGHILPAGSYWFVLTDNQANRKVVQIFSGDWSRLYGTVITAPASRPQATSRTEVKLAERRHDQPDAVWKWYYPGLLAGHQFVYPQKEEKALSQDAKLVFRSGPHATALQLAPPTS